VKNIAREISDGPRARYDHALDRTVLTEPAEQALMDEFDRRAPAIRDALAAEKYRQAMVEVARLRPVVDRFFDEVFVMTEDARLRTARLMLMVELRDLVMQIADISQLGG
jgi:glycyl-tRNA synthetase beta chain